MEYSEYLVFPDLHWQLTDVTGRVMQRRLLLTLQQLSLCDKVSLDIPMLCM